MAIAYADSLDGIEARHLHGFFVGWPRPPSPQAHLRLLAGSALIVLAIDADRVVGFITALTDGEVSAFIPLLEVLPAYQGRGIGRELMTRMLERLAGIPNVDLMCDADVVPFYERFGMQPATGMVLRRMRS